MAYPNIDPTTIFQDAFTEASVDTELSSHTPDTGTGWSLIFRDNSADKINAVAASDSAKINASQGNRGVIYSANGTYPSADYEASVKIVAGFTGTNRGYLIVRMTDKENMYALRFSTGATATRLYKKVSGTWTALGSFKTDPAVGDTVKIRVCGNVLQYFYNDVLIDQQTDSALTSAGKAGLGMGGGAELAASTDDLLNTNELEDFLVQTVERTHTFFSTSVTSMPVNLPGGIQAGDLLIAVVEDRNAPSYTKPTGWSDLFTQAGGGSVGQLRGFYKIADGTESGQVTFTAGATTTAIWVSFRIKNFHGTQAPEAATASGDSTNADSPSLSPSWGSEPTLFLSVAGHAAESAAAFSAGPSGYSDFLCKGASSSGSAVSIASADKKVTAASENPGNFTASGSNRWWAAATIAIRTLNTTPTISPDTADAHDFGSDTTPTLEFTGSDSEGNDVTYEIEIANDELLLPTVPEIRSSSQNSGTTGTDLNVSVPAGAQVGDKIVVVAVANGQTTIVDNNGSTPFTEDINDYQPNPSNGITMSIFSRVLQAGDPTTFHFTSGASGRWSIVAICPKGSQFDVSPSTGNAANADESSTGSINAPAITVANKSIHIVVATWDTAAIGTISTPSGYTLLQNANGGGEPLHASYKYFATGGSTGAVTCDNSEFGARIAISFSIKSKSTVYLDKLSASDSGFANTVSGGDTDPFNSGEKVSFTVQAGDALSSGTYYWRARAKDPSGSDTWSSWTTARSFSMTSTTTYTTTSTAKARVRSLGIVKTVTAKARVKQLSVTKTVTAKARVKYASVTKTVTARSRVKTAGVVKTVTAKARVKKLSVTTTVTAKARVKLPSLTKTHTAKARVKKTTTQTFTAKSRVKVVGVTKTSTARSRVKQLGVTKTTTARSRVKQQGVVKTFTAKASILNGGTKLKTFTAKASVRQLGVTKTITSRSRVKQASVTKTSTAKARVRQSGIVKTVTTRARVKKQAVTKNITAKARTKVSAVTKTVTSRAMVKKSLSVFVQSMARVKHDAVAVSMYARTRVKYNVSKTFTAKARLIVFGVTRTVQAKADVKKTTERTITARASVNNIGSLRFWKLHRFERQASVFNKLDESNFEDTQTQYE